MRTCVVSLMSALMVTSPVFAQSFASARTISVSGSAEVRVTPSLVNLVVGVETRNRSLAAAKAENDRRIQAIVRSMQALGVETNIMERADLDNMVAATVDRFGRVDAIINNAQTFRANAPMAEVSADDVDVFYRSGVLGTLGAMQAVYPHMKAAGWGRIVNFASSMGIVGGETFGAYNASKEAIRALTRTAAKEWAADGIVVNAIAPAAAPPRAVGSHHYEEFMKNCPMGRNGDPELDIGAVAHFLCTDACRYLTGQTFMVDGGTFLWA